MNEQELNEKKNRLFEATLKVFKRYDDTEDTTRARNLWSEYRGLITAICIMGWESEYLDYSLTNGWEVTLP